MRRLWSILALLPLMWLAGCGDRSLVLTVDILSFLDPSSTVTPYGPVPPGLPNTSVDVVTEDLNLLQGVGDVSDVATASLRIGASFDNQTGSATGTIAVHIAPGDSTDPFATAPIATIPVALLPGQITNVSAQVDSSMALGEALTQARATVALRLTFATSGSASPLQGTEALSELKAVVVTKKNL